MTGLEATERLEQAARELREEPQPGWVQLSRQVLARVRSVTRSSSPVLMDLSGLDPGEATAPAHAHVSDQVLIAALRRALLTVDGCAPVEVTLGLDGPRCVSVHAAIAGHYGADLRALGRAAAAAVSGRLRSVLGPAAPAAADVTIEIVDVTLEG